MLLLDMSAVFDTVDHDGMLHRLTHDVGMGQTVLDWFWSLLSNIVQYIHINGRHLFAILRVGSLIGLYSVRSSSPNMQHY